MKTFEQQFCLEKAGFFRRLGRDIRLLVYLGRLAFGWLVAGGRVRRDYRAKQAAKKTLWLD